jgi:Na+:H+ antiporter, NhaA family
MKKLKTSGRAVDSRPAFIEHEALAGLALVAAAVVAIVVSNTDGLSSLYARLLDLHLSIELGTLRLSKTLLHWINDGLMAVFFLLVGLELKREALEGHLSSRDQILLPALGAVGGMAAPAAVYLAVTGFDPLLFRGWAIPTATDIAFALGALAVVGSRVPASLKVFLLTLATLDDLGAILIIAAFYTDDLSLTAALLAAAALAVLVILNRSGVEQLGPYVFVGVLLWVFVLESGIHATLSGVALAFAIPMRARDGRPILSTVEDALHPYVSFFILPLFALANAGVALGGASLAAIAAPLPLGIVLGLVIGKPLGILGTVVAAVKLGAVRLPVNTGWGGMTGVACLAGIGFTMSLFIGTLAFGDVETLSAIRLAVLTGSLLSAMLGYVVLRGATRHR